MKFVLFQFLWSVVEFTENSEESTAVEVVLTTWVTILNNKLHANGLRKTSAKQSRNEQPH